MIASIALATILHDPDGQLAGPLGAAAPALRQHFAGVAVSLTEATDRGVAEVLQRDVGALVAYHPVGEAIIGRARREALRLALETGCERVLYSDLDHILRWMEADGAEMDACLSAQPEAQLLIIGRTDEAMMQMPQRLRDTEMPVNRAYELMTGRRADLLFAIRRMDRVLAGALVARSQVDSIANDVEWPLLAERLGFRIGYSDAHGLRYRTIDEFGAERDTFDEHALQWIRRIEMAGEMARTMRTFTQGH